MDYNKLQETIFEILNEGKKAKGPKKPQGQTRAELKAQADELLKKHAENESDGGKKEEEDIDAENESDGGKKEAENRDASDSARIQAALNRHKAKLDAVNQDSEGEEKAEIGPSETDIKAIIAGKDKDITGQETYKKSQERLQDRTKHHYGTMSDSPEDHESKLEKATILAHKDVSKENEEIFKKIQKAKRNAALLKLRPEPEKYYTAHTDLGSVKTPEQKIVAHGEKAMEKDARDQAKKNLRNLVKNKIEAKKPKPVFSAGIVTDLGSGIAKKAKEIRKDVKIPKDYESKHIEAFHGPEGYQTQQPRADIDTNWENHPSVQGEHGSHGYNLKQWIKKGIADREENKKKEADYEQAKREITSRPVQSPSLQRAIERVKKIKK